MNVLELGRIDYPRANWTLNDGPTQQVHFWGDGRTFTVADTQGNEIAFLVLAPTITEDGVTVHYVERVDAKTFLLTGEDGTTWLVNRRGCNCGGG